MKNSLLKAAFGSGFLALLIANAACSAGNTSTASKVADATASAAASTDTDPPDPPDVALGHRLFLETRFAQFFFKNAGSDVNALLASGDPVVGTQQLLTGTIPGAYAGQSMNCGSCHLVEEQRYAPGGSMRSYADFARRSPIPAREDGRTTTTRNTPTMVNSYIAHDGAFFPALRRAVHDIRRPRARHPHRPQLRLDARRAADRDPPHRAHHPGR